MFYYKAAVVPYQPHYVRLGATFEGLDQCTCRNDQALFVCTKCPAFQGCWLCAEKHLCSVHFAVEDAPHRCVEPVNAAVQAEVGRHRQIFQWMRQQMSVGKNVYHLRCAVYSHLRLQQPLEAPINAQYSPSVEWPTFDMPYSSFCLYAEDVDTAVFWRLREKNGRGPKAACAVLWCQRVFPDREEADCVGCDGILCDQHVAALVHCGEPGCDQQWCATCEHERLDVRDVKMWSQGQRCSACAAVRCSNHSKRFFQYNIDKKCTFVSAALCCDCSVATITASAASASLK